MPVDLLKDMITTMPRGVRLMGLDVGAKTIGLALADPDLTVVTPLKTIKRTKFTADAAEIAKIITDYEVGGLVIGLPLNMDGTEGRACQSVRDFAAELDKSLRSLPPFPSGEGRGEGVWIALQDERLSTAAVDGLVDNFVDINHRKAKSRGIIDQLAAVHILESAIGILKMGTQ